MEAGGEESDGSAPGGDPCGKAGLHLRPLGGLVGVDCSVCMVSMPVGARVLGLSAHERCAAWACLCFVPCLQVCAR